MLRENQTMNIGNGLTERADSLYANIDADGLMVEEDQLHASFLQEARAKQSLAVRRANQKNYSFK